MFVSTGLLYLDRLGEAEQAIDSARKLVGDDALLRGAEALLWAKRGEPERADENARQALASLESVSHDHHTRHYVAAALATIGQSERAVEQLRLTAETGLPNHPLFSVDPHFAPLKARPDFKELMGQLQKGWKAFRDEFGAG
jgi:hypothetical protein